MTDDTGYMRLAPGIGIIPESQRNKAYDKLEFGPGEGGLTAPRPKKAAADMDGFLAAVEAGADPQVLAAKLRGATKTKRAA